MEDAAESFSRDSARNRKCSLIFKVSKNELVANDVIISKELFEKKQNIAMTSGDVQASPFVISTSERS